MIRTLIEITAETPRDHERDLSAAMDKFGFGPKDDPEHVRFMADLGRALEDSGLNAVKMVEEYRSKRKKEFGV